MRIIKPNFEFKDERGLIREVARDDIWRQFNFYERKRGSSSGNHYHKMMEEFFYVIEGEINVKILNVKTNKKEEFTVKTGEAFKILPYEAHKIIFNADTKFITLLSQNFDSSSPDIYDYKL